MNQTSVLLFVAGATLSAGTALAQNAKFDALKAEAQADAATRTSYLAGGAGYNNNAFNINDGTGNNSLNIGGTIAARANFSVRDDQSVGDQEDFTWGFNMPFNRLRLWGNIWSKDLEYKIQGSWSDTSGDSSFGLEDAWFRYNYENGFSMTMGQFKLPLIREVLVDNEFQLAADRSVASAVFSQGYSQGIQGTYTDEMWRASVAVSDGLNTGGTDFNSGSETDVGLTGRVDVLAMGNNMDRFNDETSWKSAADNALLIGAAVHWETGGETGFTADVDTLVYTIDVSFEGQGWNVMGAFYGSHIDPAGGTDFDNFGGVLQGGIFFTDQVEAFARWDAVFLDDSVFGGQDEDIHFATVGVNYYVSPESHAVKFTAQAGYCFNDSTPLFGGGGLVSDPTRYGFLGDTEDGEWNILFQGIVMF